MIDQKHERGAMEIHYSAGGRSSHRRWVWLLGGLAVIAAVAASLVMVLSGGANNPTRAHDAVSASGHSRSPYALNNDPPPSLAGAYSDNLKTAFLALYAYAQWVYEHPRVSDVAKFDVVGSPAFKIDSYNVQYLVRRGAHNPNDPRGYDGDIHFIKVSMPPVQVRGPSGTPEYRGGYLAFGPGLVTVVCQFLNVNLYSRSGKYLQPGQRANLVAVEYSLQQGSDGQWRFYGSTRLHPSGGPLSVES